MGPLCAHCSLVMANNKQGNLIYSPTPPHQEERETARVTRKCNGGNGRALLKVVSKIRDKSSTVSSVEEFQFCQHDLDTHLIAMNKSQGLYLHLHCLPTYTLELCPYI